MMLPASDSPGKIPMDHGRQAWNVSLSAGMVCVHGKRNEWAYGPDRPAQKEGKTPSLAHRLSPPKRARCGSEKVFDKLVSRMLR